MAEEVSLAAAESKSAKFKLPRGIREALPLIALAGAGIALIFTFLIGVTSTGEGTPNYYIYHFFDGSYIKSITSITPNSWQNANRIVLVAGMVVTIVGLLAVLVFSGFTVYKAVRKYVFKDDCNVELFSLLTYIAYAVFSSLFYAVNCVVISNEYGVIERTGYNAATITGLTVTSVIFACYYVLKGLINRDYFKKKINLIKFFYTVARIVVIIVVMGLLSAPLIKVTVNGVTYNSNFIRLLLSGTHGGDPDKLNLLGTSAIAGLLIIFATSVMLAWLLTENLSVLFKNKKNDLVFYIIALVALLFALIVASVAGGFHSDILTGIITKNVSYNPEIQKIDYVRSAGGFHIIIELIGKDSEELIAVLGTINIAVSIPWAVAALGVVMFIITAAFPSVLAKAEKKITEAEEAEKIKKAAAEKREGERAFLEVNGLSQHFVIGTDFFGRPTKTLKAVDNVSFKLEKGKTLGIVGESGCGKTTMGRTILRLYDVTSGEVWFKGKKISSYNNREFDKLRPEMQMIFQDPYASLSPRLTVGDIIGEAALRHKIVDKAHYREYVLGVMKMCGLQPHYFERYPHEFSGGQRQRICIARALALKPELVVCDEPVSALDVSIQAQIINMLIDLRKSLGLTYIFISHDLSVVKHISDQVGVMYLGSLVEYGSKQAIFENTLHPYTRALFSAVPVPDPHVKMNRIILKGDIPSPVNPPKGCKFHTRCERCMEICGRIAPVYKEVEEGHFCACHLYNTEEETKQLELDYEEQQRLAAEAEEEANKGKSKK